MPEWLVELKGDQGDLAMLAGHLRSADPSIKEENDGRYWLRFSGLNSLNDPREVREEADRLVGIISGAAKHLGDLQPIEVNAIALDSGTGPPHQFVQLSPLTATLSARFPMSTDRLIRLIDLAEKDAELAEALYFLQKDNWFNLYKAWEVARDAAGAIRRGASEGTRQDIIDSGWANETEQWRFRATAQCRKVLGDEARHAGKRAYDGPGKPMSIDEAREFMGRLIDAWIRELDSKP